jgi:hypothetical protein
MTPANRVRSIIAASASSPATAPRAGSPSAVRVRRRARTVDSRLLDDTPPRRIPDAYYRARSIDYGSECRCGRAPVAADMMP